MYSNRALFSSKTIEIILQKNFGDVFFALVLDLSGIMAYILKMSMPNSENRRKSTCKLILSSNITNYITCLKNSKCSNVLFTQLHS